MSFFKKSPEKALELASKGVDLVGKVLPDTQETRNLKGDIIKAEINSDSEFLKRARPTVIYAGVVLIFMEALGIRLALLTLFVKESFLEKAIDSSDAILMFFFVAWGGVVGTYVVTRGKEKMAGKALVKSLNK